MNDPQYIDQGWFGPYDPYWTYGTGAGYNLDYAVSKPTRASPHYWVPGTTYMGYQEVFTTWVGGTGYDDIHYHVNHSGGSEMTSADQTQAPPDTFPDDPLAWKKLGGSEYVRYVYDGVTSVETYPWGYQEPPEIRTTCIDAVLVHHVLPLCDIDTDSNNNGSITDEDDPVENADAGPGRIVPVGSSQLTEVHLEAAPVDAVLAMPQDWREAQVNAIFTPPLPGPRIECGGMARIVLVYGLIQTLRMGEFDQLWNTDTVPIVESTLALNDTRPGDWVYFRNDIRYVGGPMPGENAIRVSVKGATTPRFWGWGDNEGPTLTYAQWKQALIDAFKETMKYPISDVPGYQGWGRFFDVWIVAMRVFDLRMGTW